MPGCTDPERQLRDLEDEFRLELEAKAAAGPLAPPTPKERMRAALDWFMRTQEEAEADGVDPDTLPRVIGATVRDALAEAEAAPDDPFVLEEAAGDIGWAAGQVEDFVRFARFGAEEEARRRDLAEVVRQRARKLQRRSGGSYTQARRFVVSNLRHDRRPPGERPRQHAPRRRGRRGHVARRARSPGRQDPEPAPPLGRHHSRQTATKVRYATSSRSSWRSHFEQTGRPLLGIAEFDLAGGAVLLVDLGGAFVRAHALERYARRRPMSGRERLWATRLPPHLPGSRAQQAKLGREVERLGLIPRCRAVLLTACKQADGAGFSWFKIDSEKGDTSFRLQSGCSVPTIYRALADLRSGDEPLLRSWPLLRTAEWHGRRESHRARQGFELSIFQLGWRLRRAADLREVDVFEHLGLRGPNERAENRPIPLQVRPSHTLEAERALTENGRPLFEGSVRLGETFGVEQGQEERDSTERLLAALPSQGRSDMTRLKTEDDDSTDRLLVALDLTSAKPTSPVLPPTSDEGREEEPTLEEALLDPVLFERYIAPYASLVENEEGVG